MLGNFDEAEKQYLQALKQEPNNVVVLRNLASLFLVAEKNDRAVPYLEKILALVGNDDPVTQQNVAWARRVKADLLLQEGSYKSFLDALALLEKNADASGQLPQQDLLAWLRACANRPDAASWQLALRRLRDIQAQRSLVAEEKRILAALQRATGSWDEAKRTMLSLLTESSNDPQVVNTFVLWLLDEGELNEASVWARKLPANSQEAVRVQAELLVRQGKPNDAARLLIGLLPKNVTAENARQWQAVIQTMETLGKFNKGFYKLAERQWQQYVKARPQEDRYLIEFLARVPEAARLDQAFDMAEKKLANAVRNGDQQQVVQIVNMGIDSLRRHRRHLSADSPQFGRIAKWLQAARQAGLPDLTIAWLETEFYDLQGDRAKLEELYRSILARNDLDEYQRAVVQNNLAFLLAVSRRGEEALQVIGNAIDQLGPRADLLDTRAMAHLASGRYEAAIKDLRTAIADGGGTVGMLFHLALAEYQAGDREQAAAALRQSIDRGLVEAELSEPEAVLLRRLQNDLKPLMEKEQTDRNDVELSLR